MSDQTQFESGPRPRRGLSALFLLLGIVIGGGAVALLEPSLRPPPAPATAPLATIPSETTQAIQDLRTGQQKAADQMQAIQQQLQGLTSAQADAKQLSSQVAAVSDKLAAVGDKLEALRQSFASQAVPTTAPEPATRRRGTR